MFILSKGLFIERSYYQWGVFSDLISKAFFILPPFGKKSNWTEINLRNYLLCRSSWRLSATTVWRQSRPRRCKAWQRPSPTRRSSPAGPRQSLWLPLPSLRQLSLSITLYIYQVFIKYFVGVPHLATCIFLIFSTMNHHWGQGSILTWLWPHFHLVFWMRQGLNP